MIDLYFFSNNFFKSKLELKILELINGEVIFRFNNF